MLRNLAKDTFIYGGGDLVLKLVAFAMFPLIAAALSPKAFGALELLGTSSGLLGLFVNCGLNNSVQRFYWDNETIIEDRSVIVSSGFAILIVLGSVIGFIFILFGTPFFQGLVLDAEIPMTSIAFISSVVLMLVSQLLQYLLDVLRLHFEPIKFLLLSFSHRVLGLLFGVFAVVWLGRGADGLIFAQMVVACSVLPLGIFLAKKDISLRIDIQGWGKKLVLFGYPFIFSGLAYWLFGSMDRWMLASMASVKETGLYSVAFRFSSIVLFVSMAFGQAWSPYAIKIKSDYPKDYRAFYARVLLIFTFCMFVVGGGVALFSGEMIGLLMPEEYADSAVPLSILCLGIVLQGTQQITAIGISLEKKTSIFARMAWLTALVNFCANWFLIPRLGASGAAWGTCVSYFVLTSGYLFFTQRLHPLPISWIDLARLLLLGCIVFYAGIVFNSVEWDWKIVLFKIMICVVCLLLGYPVLRAKGKY